MTPEKWSDTVGHIKDNFKVSDEGGEHIDEEGGIDIQYIEFESPLGEMRLEFVKKPVILDKKTTYSKRIGSETKIDYVYSKDEYSHKMTAYKWDDNEESWVEIEAGNIFS